MKLNGVELYLDVSGCVVLPEARVLAVADLHFGKGTYFALHGAFTPPYDSHQTLDCLEDAIDRFDPQTVICLGDSFHDGGAFDRLDAETRGRLIELGQSRQWIWIAGNHDPELPSILPGRRVESLFLQGLKFCHEPSPEKRVHGEVSGHLHPCASVGVGGQTIRQRCFVSDGNRLIVPAFGAYTGGLDVHEEAISCCFANGFTAWMIGRDRVRAIARQHLRIPRHVAGTRT